MIEGFLDGDFLQQQYLLCNRILRNKSYCSSDVFRLYNIGFIKLFYVLYLIRELTIFFYYNVPNFAKDGMFLHLKCLYNSLVSFLDENANDNNISESLVFFLNDVVLQLYELYIYHNLDMSFFKLNVNIEDESYLDRSSIYFLDYFFFYFQVYFPLGENEQGLSKEKIVLLYQQNLGMLRNQVQNQLNVSNKKGFYFFFHIFFEFNLRRLFFHYTDIDFVLDTLQLYLDNVENNKFYLDYCFENIFPFLFGLLIRKISFSSVMYSTKLINNLYILSFFSVLNKLSFDLLEHVLYVKHRIDGFSYNLFIILFYLKFYIFHTDIYNFPTKNLFLLYRLYEKCENLVNNYKQNILDSKFLFLTLNEVLRFYLNIDILPPINKYIYSVNTGSIIINNQDRFLFYKYLNFSFFSYCVIFFYWISDTVERPSAFCSIAELKDFIQNVNKLYNIFLQKNRNDLQVNFNYEMCIRLYIILFEYGLFCYYFNFNFNFELLKIRYLSIFEQNRDAVNCVDVVFTLLDDIFNLNTLLLGYFDRIV